jgi:menaquinone-dependent protoporphyrinogen oxidase
MKILIAYYSKHGTAERIAGIINVKLNGLATLANLRKVQTPDFVNFDIIILGGSIYMGIAPVNFRKLLSTNTDILLNKPLALYLSCIQNSEIAKQQFENSFPAELREHAFATGLLGGEIIYDKLNFFEKLIIKRTQNISNTTTRLKSHEIEIFTDKIIQYIASISG